MSDNESYNGWGNYETWLVNLWLTNDEGTHTELIEDAAAFESEADFAYNLRAFVTEEFGPPECSGLLGDAWRAFLDHVRWREIAKQFQCFAKDRRARASGESSPAGALGFPEQAEKEASQLEPKQSAPSSAHDAQLPAELLKRGFKKAIPMEHKDDAPKVGEIIDGMEVVSSYSTRQAVEDGVLVPVGNVWGAPVYMTANLFSKGYEDEQKRFDLVSHGLNLLTKDDPEDTPYMKLRVIEEGKAWVIYEPGERPILDKYTYMAPEDY